MNSICFTLLKAGLFVAFLVTAPAAYATGTLPATGITQTSATVNAFFTGTAGFTIAWAGGPGANICFPPGAGAQSCLAAGLACGTPYTFLASDNNNVGVTLGFTTLACPPPPPGGGGGGVTAPLLGGWWTH